jgi:hypothetical protein
MNAMENLSDEELENFDAEDFSTYPTILTDMFTVFDQNYAASAVASLTSADCGNLESMLFSWLNQWAGSLAEDNAGGDLYMYLFSGRDVTSEAGELSAETDDELVLITMDQGDDTQWSRLSIRIEVNGEAPRTCANPGQDSADYDCVIVDNGFDTTDQDFAVGESFTIQEDGQDICDGTSQCEVVVIIVEVVEGRTLDEITVMAS